MTTLIYKNSLSSLSTGREYHRIYRDMQGVDLSGGQNAAGVRFAFLQNMYRDWEGDGDGGVESVPGFRRLLSLSKPVRRFFTQRTEDGEYLIFHAGDTLYRLPLAGRDDPSTLQTLRVVGNTVGCGFCNGDTFYYLSGGHITVVGPGGLAAEVGDALAAKPYVPLTRRNGTPCEQRNLLSLGFREETDIATRIPFSYGTPGLAYSLDPTATDASVLLSGRGTATEAEIHVPAYVRFHGVLHRVGGIAPGAFARDAVITSLTVAEGGVSVIGEDAFRECAALTQVVLGDGVSGIGVNAFYSCRLLEGFYFTPSCRTVGNNALGLCPMLTTLHYAGTDSEFSAFDEGSYFRNLYTIEASSPYPTVKLCFPVYSAAASVSKVNVGGSNRAFTCETEGDFVTAVVVTLPQETDLQNTTLTLTGTLTEGKERTTAETPDFFTRFPGTSGTAAVAGCTVAEVFDGRVFLSGNPALPGVVFYSQDARTGGNCPTYFGIYNYFQDGIGHIGVRDMLAAGAALMVFKDGDDGGGSIFYHTAKSTDSALIPKIYPTLYVHVGLPALGPAVTFFDDPLFLSAEGVTALEKPSVSTERRAVVRSSRIAERLLSEDLRHADVAVAGGYLAVLCGGRIYLADGRRICRQENGELGYEWYLLDGVGTCTGDTRVYRYASVAPPGYEVAPVTDIPVTGEVMSVTEEDGTVVRYVAERGHKFAVYATEEFTGGVFSPATTLHGTGHLLFFGTETGHICLFNTDKRGVAPDRIRNAADFDSAAYAAAYGRRIHPDFYDFDRHAPRYALKTAPDDCGIPHLTKDTVRRSLTVRCRTSAPAAVTAEVGTDRGGFRQVTVFPGGTLSFRDMDFSALVLDGAEEVTVPLAEGEKRWVEKQIALYADGFRAPIGVTSIAFRYTVGGRIKLC